MLNKRVLPIILIICALTGVASSFLLVYERHFRNINREIKHNAVTLLSLTRALCGEKHSFISCDRVDASSHSRFLSVPQTSWGMMYFLLLFFSTIPFFFLRENPKKDYVKLIFWFLIFGSLYSIYMFAVSLIAIRALCPLCMVTYVANWVSLGVVVLEIVRNRENPFKLIDSAKNLLAAIMLKRKTALTVLCVVICSSVAAGFFLDQFILRLKSNFVEKSRNAIIDKIVAEFYAQSAMDVRPSFVCAIGNPAARVTIVEFSDFLCPHCKKASEFIKQAASEFGDKVRVVFMNVPLESQCNSQVKKDLHPGACMLAKGSICAARQSAFQTYMDHAFNLHPRNAGREEMLQLAVISGLEIAEFERCLTSAETEYELKKQIDEAHRLNIHSTPTIFINGKILKNWGDVEIIKKAIGKILSEAN